MLWLAIHLPQLPLDLLSTPGPGKAADATSIPLAIEESSGQARRLVACNAAAAAQGVRAGQATAVAMALCGALQLRPRQLPAERAALERLATWAMGYTSQVGVQGHDGLLLEIAASQRLFGGIVPLLRRLEADLEALGYRTRLAVAPTPAGARLLARAGERRIVRGQPALARAIAALPLTLAEASAETIGDLAGIGVHRFEALLRLPRAEIARRFGHALIGYLDRLLGQRPEPVAPFQAPQRFRAQLELPYAVEHTEGLGFALQRLLRELAAWLLVRQFALLKATITLGHEGREPSRVVLGLCAPSGDAAHFATLARAQLDRLQLPAPVLTLALEAQECVALTGASHDLFRNAHEREDIARAIERLSSRLGADAVHVPALAADHRPERAGTWRAPAAGVREAPVPYAAGPRPLYLLQTPQPLDIWLQRQGAALLEGPERLESGWWDGAPVARDYYRLRTLQGTDLWVYREREPREGWYVHGLYA